MSTILQTPGDGYQKQAVEYFNATWDLLDKTDRSEEDNLAMIHRTHASRYLWGLVGDYPQFATGEWQVSRVYAVLDTGQSALYHGKASLRFCEQGKLSAFDFAFAHEAIARAYALLGDQEGAMQNDKLAKEYAISIEDAGNREYLLSELKTIKLKDQ